MITKSMFVRAGFDPESEKIRVVEDKAGLLVSKLIELTKSGKISWKRDGFGNYLCVEVKSVYATVVSTEPIMYIRDSGDIRSPTHKIESDYIKELQVLVKDSVMKKEMDDLMAELEELGGKN